jgi:hypothetical protein
MGRKPFPFTEEHLSMMGKVPDVQIAEEAGCVAPTVANYRVAHAIPPPPRRQGRAGGSPRRAVYSRFIGLVPDAEIAEAFSVSRQAVGLARNLRGIPAGTPPTYALVSAVFALMDGADVGKTRVTVPKSLYDAVVEATSRTETTCLPTSKRHVVNGRK